MTDVLTGRIFDGLQTFLQRGKVPIVVGGTGFYLRWYVHGRPQTPASTQDSVARVQQLLKEARQLPMCARHVISDVAAELATCRQRWLTEGHYCTGDLSMICLCAPSLPLSPINMQEHAYAIHADSLCAVCPCPIQPHSQASARCGSAGMGQGGCCNGP